MKKRTKRSARKPTSTPHPSPQVLDPLPPGTSPVVRQGREAVTYHIPISLPPPSLSSSPTQSPYKTTISLPRYSTWTSGLHFHTTHTEYLRLVQGAIFIYLDGETNILSAKAGGSVTIHGDKKVAPGLLVTVPKYARHNWGRACEHLVRSRLPSSSSPSSNVTPNFPKDIDDDVVVEEWTEPGDISKPLFFWNLNGIMLTPFSAPPPLRQQVARWVLGPRYWLLVQLFTVFWGLDNWPVVLDLRGVVGEGMGWWLLKIVLGEREKRGVEWCVTMAVVGFVRVVGWIVGVGAVERGRTPVELWDAWRRVS